MDCERCGRKLVDLTKPCPDCGGFNHGYGQNMTKAPKHKINLNIIIIVFFIICSFFIIKITAERYYLKEEYYQGTDFKIKYAISKWKEFDMDDDNYGVLLYNNGTTTHVSFQKKLIDLNLDLRISEEREKLYRDYVSYFFSNSERQFTNVMDHFQETTNNILYLTADYRDYNDLENRGKIYIVHTYDGRALTFWLSLDKTTIVDVDDEVLTLITNMEYKKRS